MAHPVDSNKADSSLNLHDSQDWNETITLISEETSSNDDEIIFDQSQPSVNTIECQYCEENFPKTYLTAHLKDCESRKVYETNENSRPVPHFHTV